MIYGVSGASLLAWILVAAFLGAGSFNIRGSASTKEGFVRWGYPAWWNVVTGGLELLAAALVAFPPTRLAGLLLGGAICLAAVATIVRHREYAHLPPGVALTALFAVELLLIGAI